MTQPLPPGLAETPEESWEDRIREGAYTSPGGARLTYQFRDVSRRFTKRGTAWQFPGVNGAYIQQRNIGPRTYPMILYFSGAQHDLIAKAFEEMLAEDGVGKLEHPLYGRIDVVPLGEVDRRDDLVTAANQTVIEVTFWTTIRVLYPNAQAHPESEIKSAVAGFNAQAAQQFASSMKLQDAVNKANAGATSRSLLKTISAGLQGVSDTVASVRSVFADAQKEINFGMDVLIGQPLLLAQQISDLIQAPARAIAGIESRLEAYGRLLDSILDSPAADTITRLASGTALLTRVERVANDFHIADHMALSAVGGAVLAVATTPRATFVTRPQAIRAADAVIAMLDKAIAWREPRFVELENARHVDAFQVDSGVAYQQAASAVALTAGMLTQLSFDLALERSIILTRNRTILDLASELYQRTDNDTLDLLITSNNLSGSEILELERGRRVVYYA